MKELDKLNSPTEAHGLAFHFPEYPTTPQCHRSCNVAVPGFSGVAIGTCIGIVGFQAAFNHAHVSVRLGPLPHAQGVEAIDKDHATHFTFLDHPFCTAVQSDRACPGRCGEVGDHVSNRFFKQLAFPFRWKG